MKTTVSIIGGGLSGLLVAYRLVQKGIDFKIVEANQRLGGRILSTPTGAGESDALHQPAIDLGPSWFWPGQEHMANLIRELNLNEFVFSQACTGAAVIEYNNGSLEKRQGGASMEGSYRVSGGMFHLIKRLSDAIAQEALLTNSRVTKLRRTSHGMTTVANSGSTEFELTSEVVVVAVPPRVVANTMAFQPGLSDDYLSALLSVPTWMAGQAKFVAVYSEPFWRQNGLSGDGMSQLGPLVEIHDASPQSGGPYALFGFVGVPAAHRVDREDEVQSAAIEQLVRMFGSKAASPVSVHYKDWAFDSLTSTDLDRDSQRVSTAGGLDLITFPEHDVLWAGTETAEGLHHSNGYLEGAVESGERAASLLIERFDKTTQETTA